MLSAVQISKIDALRVTANALIASRTEQPSKLWHTINGYLDYIRYLPTEQLENIRAHVGMGYFLGAPWGWFKSEEVPLIEKYERYCAGLPEKYWLSDPSEIGFLHNGRRINKDIVKEQATVANLYALGLLSDAPLRVLEIGAGYGNLVYQLSRCLHADSQFVIVDTPEMLFWSGVYLIVNGCDVYMWKDGDTREHAEEQFLLVPDSALDFLGVQFDLAINKNSFQEMTEAQVVRYASTLAKITRSVYSYNASRQFMNDELVTHVEDILAKYFENKVVFGKKDGKRLFVGGSYKCPVKIWVDDKELSI